MPESYIGDYYNNRVSRVDARTGIMTTIAGNGRAGFSGENVDARNATLSETYGLAVDDARKLLYIAGNERVRKVDLVTNMITTAADGGKPVSGNGDGGPATEAAIGVPIGTVAGGGSNPCCQDQLATSVSVSPAGVGLDARGNLLVVDWSWPGQIRRVNLGTGSITIVAGGGQSDQNLGDNGPAVGAQLFYPYGVASDAAGHIYIADSRNDRIRAVRGPIP